MHTAITPQSVADSQTAIIKELRRELVSAKRQIELQAQSYDHLRSHCSDLSLSNGEHIRRAKHLESVRRDALTELTEISAYGGVLGDLDEIAVDDIPDRLLPVDRQCLMNAINLLLEN